MSDYKPSFPFNVPMYLLTPTTKTVKGVAVKTFPEPTQGELIYCSFKTYGGTESQKDGLYAVIDTSNAIVALAGALYAQYKGSVSLPDGRGAIVIALAAIYIGLSVSLKIKPNFVVSLIGVVCGGVVYYIIYNFVILLGLKTDYLKMLSAIIVALFLAVPYLKNEYFRRKKPLPVPPEAGGDGNA